MVCARLQTEREREGEEEGERERGETDRQTASVLQCWLSFTHLSRPLDSVPAKLTRQLDAIARVEPFTMLRENWLSGWEVQACRQRLRDASSHAGANAPCHGDGLPVQATIKVASPPDAPSNSERM